MKRMGIVGLVGMMGLTACADLFVFSKDGTNVVSAPMNLPSVAVRLDTRQPVLGLYAAEDAERAACGWYKCVACTNAAPEGMVVSGRAWSLDGHLALETIVFAPAPPPPAYVISKYKLLCELKTLGALPSFAQYLASDAERKMLFDAATVLDSDNSMVTEAAALLVPALGISQSAMSNLLWRCRSDDR